MLLFLAFRGSIVGIWIEMWGASQTGVGVHFEKAPRDAAGLLPRRFFTYHRKRREVTFDRDGFPLLVGANPVYRHHFAGRIAFAAAVDEQQDREKQNHCFSSFHDSSR
jgi:hypothetical protein